MTWFTKYIYWKNKKKFKNLFLLVEFEQDLNNHIVTSKRCTKLMGVLLLLFFNCDT